ncbi:MAG: histidine phosphatase family protein [Spirochaetes bacterium]|nr:histidine phosphatase family protein [Spirochaetota bacterium]
MSPWNPIQYRRVILIRHGESKANQERTLTGRTDPELTARGRKQAARAARLLGRHGWQFDALYSSPLRRALHTARCISRRVHLPVQKDELLLETNFGTWEGVGKEELARLPHWERYVQDPFHFRFPEGESPQDVRKRIGLFIDSLRSAADWNAVIVVSHYTPIVFFILHILGSEEGKRAPFAIDNASLTVVRISDTSGYIEQLNCTPH